MVTAAVKLKDAYSLEEKFKRCKKQFLKDKYAEYIMWNARLDEAQAGIKIAGRNINNLRYADDTTLMQKVKKN